MTEDRERSSRPVWLGEDKRKWDHVRVHLQVLHDDRLDAYSMAVYFGLTAHAEIQSGAARPSMDTLARYGGMSSRKVHSCVALLVEAGYIEVEHRKGKASRYFLLPPPPLHQVLGSDADPGTTCRAPKHDVPHTPAPGADEQEPRDKNQEPEEPLSRGESESESALEEPLFVSPEQPLPSFADFWNCYPYKRGSRGAAERAWKAAVKKAPPAVILEGARRLAADPNLPPKADEQWVSHGSTWLRNQGWKDGPLSPRARKPSAARPPSAPIDNDRDAPGGTYKLDPETGKWVLVPW